MRGISSALTAVLLTTITVGLVGTSYMYITYFSGRVMSQTFEIIDVIENKVLVRNTGTETINEFMCLIDGQEVECYIKDGSIEPGHVGAVILSGFESGWHDLEIVSKSMSLRWSGKLFSSTSTTSTTTSTTITTTSTSTTTISQFCGDGSCNGVETYSSCPQDCCDSDCTATYDSTCHSECNNYNGCSLASGCNLKELGSYICCNSSYGHLQCCGGSCIDCGICKACSSGSCSSTPADDPDCGIIDCDELDTTCRDYHDLTSDRCKSFGACKTPNSADCTSYTDAPSTTTCGTKDCSASYDDYCSGNSLCTYSDCTRYCSGTGICNDCSCTASCSSCGLTGCPSDYCYGLNFYNYPNTCTNPCVSKAGDDSCGTCTCSATKTTCSASGCCDATCSATSGCGLSPNDANCPSGYTCKSDCSCVIVSPPPVTTQPPSGGGCPILKVFDGKNFIKVEKLNIHAPKEIDARYTSKFSMEPINGRYEIILEEAAYFFWDGSHIDSVELFDETGKRCELISAVHSKHGDVLQKIKKSDDVRVRTFPGEEVRLVFDGCSGKDFTFRIEGYNMKIPNIPLSLLNAIKEFFSSIFSKFT